MISLKITRVGFRYVMDYSCVHVPRLNIQHMPYPLADPGGGGAPGAPPPNGRGPMIF